MTRSGRMWMAVAVVTAGCSHAETYRDGVVELDVAGLLTSPVTVDPAAEPVEGCTTTLEIDRADGILERAVLWVCAEVELDGPAGCDGPGLLSATLSLYPLEGDGAYAPYFVDELDLSVVRDAGGSIDLGTRYEQPWEPEPVGHWSGGADGVADCERVTPLGAWVSLDWVFEPDPR